MRSQRYANTISPLFLIATDNHENIPLRLPVPGKAIVYKGASPVKPTPFTFEK